MPGTHDIDVGIPYNFQKQYFPPRFWSYNHTHWMYISINILVTSQCDKLTWKNSLKQNTGKSLSHNWGKKPMNWEFPNNVGVREWQVFFPPPGSSSCTGTCRLQKRRDLGDLGFFSAKNAVKLCSKVYEFTTLFLNWISISVPKINGSILSSGLFRPVVMIKS